MNEQQSVADIKLQAQTFADDLKADTENAGKITNQAMALLRNRILALQATDANLRGEVGRLRQESVSQCEQLAGANESLRVAREGSLHVRSPDVLTCPNDPSQAGSASTPQQGSDGSLIGRPPTVSTNLTDPAGLSSHGPSAAQAPGASTVCTKCPLHIIQIRKLNEKEHKNDTDYRKLWDEKKSVMEKLTGLQEETETLKGKLERREEERQTYYASNDQLVQENSLLTSSCKEKEDKIGAMLASASRSSRKVSISPDGAGRRKGTRSPAPRPGIASPGARIRTSSRGPKTVSNLAQRTSLYAPTVAHAHPGRCYQRPHRQRRARRTLIPSGFDAWHR